MAKNDTILLDGILDERVEGLLPSGQRDEVFEYFALEQTLKDYDLSADELQFGWIDGGRDGGIDGFYTFVNGHLLQEPEEFPWPRSHSELQLYLVTCKHATTFKEATIDKLIATCNEIFDFTIPREKLDGKYSTELLTARQNFLLAYRKLSHNLQRFAIKIVYASRGDVSALGDEVEGRSKQLERLLSSSFSKCETSFDFVDSALLLDAYRRQRKYSLELPFVEDIARGERYIILAKLSDYYKFIVDESGKLRRYLFDSNVRDYMGLNSVNSDIINTLKSNDGADFWWLNNGITMLASAATITGKQIQISDIQIVNGLQTTESIFRYFSQHAVEEDGRCVLIKIVVSQDESIRDGIIKATNNQTAVEIASLHATDRIQRNIEDALLRSSVYYERRKNFYVNQGYKPSDVVTPQYLAAAYDALVLRRPQHATVLRSKFMRNPDEYAKIFDPEFPMDGWAKIAVICREVDAALEKMRPTNRTSERFLRAWRYIVAFICVSKSAGKFDYSIDELQRFDLARLTLDEVRSVYEELLPIAQRIATKYPWSSRRSLSDAMRHYGELCGIAGSDSYMFSLPEQRRVQLTNELIEQVAASVPPQPWKPGLHKRMAEHLNCSIDQYFAAIESLISDGRLLRQRDGVLYDQAGNVVGFDPDRVDGTTLQLKVSRH